jgi:hypothetical protein
MPKTRRPYLHERPQDIQTMRHDHLAWEWFRLEYAARYDRDPTINQRTFPQLNYLLKQHSIGVVISVIYHLFHGDLPWKLRDARPTIDLLVKCFDEIVPGVTTNNPKLDLARSVLTKARLETAQEAMRQWLPVADGIAARNEKLIAAAYQHMQREVNAELERRRNAGPQAHH